MFYIMFPGTGGPGILDGEKKISTMGAENPERWRMLGGDHDSGD